MTISVLLVDDQPAVRSALRDLLEQPGEIDIAGEAADGAEALDLASNLRPDVVLMDVRMPRMDGVAATQAIRDRFGDTGPRVLVLTTFDLDAYVYAALRAGASGFLIKNAPPEDLRRAIRVIAEGNALLDPAVTRRVIAHFTGAPNARQAQPSVFDELTVREREIALLVARGLSNEEIGAALSVSYWTVKTHVAHILDKLDVRDRSQIVIAAYDAGLIPH